MHAEASPRILLSHRHSPNLPSVDLVTGWTERQHPHGMVWRKARHCRVVLPVRLLTAHFLSRTMGHPARVESESNPLWVVRAHLLRLALRRLPKTTSSRTSVPHAWEQLLRKLPRQPSPVVARSNPSVLAAELRARGWRRLSFEGPLSPVREVAFRGWTRGRSSFFWRKKEAQELKKVHL
ncbi:hypothetical protein K402DRAFT_89702 [Aulographum hederae CBS 113979]|uniref:Uncharacterized protein n=1 Tax=Aulographum hederae CBS 113979 TaxID=1176131 RepID=A0A6G1GZR6_9PEZI|nr:hypothetical protein K402DRAFT_89702 [Aulographum hederae CBS 113979]